MGDGLDTRESDEQQRQMQTITTLDETKWMGRNNDDSSKRWHPQTTPEISGFAMFNCNAASSLNHLLIFFFQFKISFKVVLKMP